MQIKVNSGQIQEGMTSFRRITKEKDRKFVFQGGKLHLERIYASGGVIVSVFHNYATNKEEFAYDTIHSALEKYRSMAEMRQSSPEWVDEGLMPAILKAVRAAQRQEAEGRGLVEDMGDPTLEDIEEECNEIAALIAQARKDDPELDEEMTRAEMDEARKRTAAKAAKSSK